MVDTWEPMASKQAQLWLLTKRFTSFVSPVTSKLPSESPSVPLKPTTGLWYLTQRHLRDNSQLYDQPDRMSSTYQ